MQCNESTIYTYPQFSQFNRQYFLQTIENSKLLTNFTTDFTNLSLKLKLVIESDAKQFHFVLNRDNGSFTGQHMISLDPSKRVERKLTLIKFFKLIHINSHLFPFLFPTILTSILLYIPFLYKVTARLTLACHN